MLFQGIFSLAVFAVAILSGLDRLSFWWVLIPAFIAASFGASNRYFDTIQRANKAGHLSVMPTLIGAQWLGYVVTGGIVYGLTRLIA